MIKCSEIYGSSCRILSNDALEVAVLEDFGAKIASIRHLGSGMELLHQPQKESYQIPSYNASFEDFDTSGIDECFPTIDACEVKGVYLPDHGELWSVPWEITSKGEVLTCIAKSRAYPLTFVREMTLEGSSLHLDYRVINLGEEDLPYLWAFHGLQYFDDDTELVFGDVGSHINVMAGTTIPEEYKALKNYGDKGAYKFYFIDAQTTGDCGVYHRKADLSIRMIYNTEKVPYLGCWITKGGFKGEYNLALEPCTGFYDALDCAVQNEKITVVKGGEEVKWRLTLHIGKGYLWQNSDTIHC